MCLKEEHACTEPKTISMGNGRQIIKVCEGCFSRWAPRDFGQTPGPEFNSDMPDNIGDAHGKPEGWRFGLDEPVYK